MTDRSSTDWEIQDANTTVWREDLRIPVDDGGSLVLPNIVNSFNGRVGDVTSIVGDYESAQVTIVPAISVARPWGDVRLYLTNLSSQVDTAQGTADSAISIANGAASTAGNALLKSGGTMVGDIVLARDADQPLEPATLRQMQAADALAMPKSGGTFTGAVILAGDGLTALQPVTKQQLDALSVGVTDPNALPKSGGTMTGFIVLHANAAAAMNPVTKQQLDALSSTIGNYLPLTGGTLSGNLTIDRAVAGNSTLTLQNTGAVTGVAQIIRSATAAAFLDVQNQSPFGQPAQISLSPSPAQSAQDTLVQLFRNTLASGKRALQWIKGDGSLTVVAEAALNAGLDGLAWTGKQAFSGAVTVAADPAVPLGVATKQYVDAVSAVAMSAEDNLIINGGMEIWQRGTSGFTSVGAVVVKTADRWNIFADTGATVGAARDTRPLPEQRYFSHAFQRTVAGSGTSQLWQNIENVRTADGQTVTISFDIYSSVPTTGLYVALTQFFGTGGSPSSAVVAWSSSTFATVGGAWERKTFTGQLTSTAGKTLGSNGDDNLRFTIGMPAAAGLASWYVSNVDLRLGSLAPTKFLRRQIQEELALCQRYYQAIGSVLVAGYNTAGGTTWADFWHPVVMRATPTVTLANQAYGNASGYAAPNLSPSHTKVTIVTTALGYATATADIRLDAEL